MRLGRSGVGSGSEHLPGPRHPEDVAFIVHFASSLCSPQIEQEARPPVKWKFRGRERQFRLNPPMKLKRHAHGFEHIVLRPIMQTYWTY